MATASSEQQRGENLPLVTLLSYALVAFTIEADNELEHRMPHRTTRHGGSRHAPWLVSLVMWFNCMRFVGSEGVTVRALERLARTATNLAGMGRWGYIVVAPDPSDRRPKPPHADWVVHATPAGRRAQEVWRPLCGVIETRWQQRFGSDAMGSLHAAMVALVSQLDAGLPDCLPILGYGLTARDVRPEQRIAAANASTNPDGLALPALLSKLLLAFTLEFEREAEVSLAISANVLRLVGDQGVPIRDLPRLATVSREASAVALSFLEKQGYAVVQLEAPGSRTNVVVLTPKGLAAQASYRQLVWAIEERWRSRFSHEAMGHLREALEQVVGHSIPAPALLSGIDPYPDGWRAAVPRPDGLPHYPMVLHRGGFPDGS
jgi:DNA-binding MarR family transcriptional regulator